MPQEFAPPGIPQEGLKKLSVETAEGAKFKERLTRYGKNLFKREKVYFDIEKPLVDKSAAAQAYVKNRYHAALIVTLEKRLGKTFNAAYASQYLEVKNQIATLAKEVGFNAGDADFNCLTFIDCCLDQMGVKEADSYSALPENAAKLDEMIGLNLKEIDPKLNKEIAERETYRVAHGIRTRKGVWNEELFYILE